MHTNNKPLTDAELELYEAQRDIGTELLQAIAEMKAGQGKSALLSAIVQPPDLTTQSQAITRHLCLATR